MTQINIQDAGVELSRVLELLETEEEDRIFLLRGDIPVAQITLIPPQNRRIGVAEGKFTVPDDFDLWDREIEEAFEGTL